MTELSSQEVASSLALPLREQAARGLSGDPLPAAVYFHPELFAFEQSALLSRSWHFVAHASELPLPGTWKRVEVCGESVLIARGADLGLRAHYNVCRHRGVALVEGERGRLGAFECPYHGFTYELDGRLRSAARTRIGSDVDCASTSLVPVELRERHGLLFVSVEASEANAFEVAMKGMPPWLVRAPLAEITRVYGDVHEVAANWKVLAENFQESDHFVKVHPQLEACTPTSKARTWNGDGIWLGGLMEFAKGVETVSTSGTRSARPFLAAPEDRARVSDSFMFPTLLTSLQPDYLLTYRLDPLTPLRTRVHFEIYLHRSFSGDANVLDDLVGWWQVVNRQDRDICEKQQRGLSSRGYKPLPLGNLEEGLVQFHRLLRKAYAAGAERSEK